GGPAGTSPNLLEEVPVLSNQAPVVGGHLERVTRPTHGPGPAGRRSGVLLEMSAPGVRTVDRGYPGLGAREKEIGLLAKRVAPKGGVEADPLEHRSVDGRRRGQQRGPDVPVGQPAHGPGSSKEPVRGMAGDEGVAD